MISLNSLAYYYMMAIYYYLSMIMIILYCGVCTYYGTTCVDSTLVLPMIVLAASRIIIVARTFLAIFSARAFAAALVVWLLVLVYTVLYDVDISYIAGLPLPNLRTTTTI